jgi:hypothetical protein
MDISKLSIGELKILAYDTIRKLEGFNKDLQLLNNRIKQMEEYKSPEEVEATPVEETVDDDVHTDTPVEEVTE